MPSDYREGTNPSLSHAVSFLRNQRDLRVIFSSEQTIKDRTDRSVCVFDGRGNGRNNREIKVDANTTLKDVLALSGTNFDEVGVQVKLITRNALLQSPVDRSINNGADFNAFAKTHVSPGDFVFLTYFTSYGGS